MTHASKIRTDRQDLRQAHCAGASWGGRRLHIALDRALRVWHREDCHRQELDRWPHPIMWLCASRRNLWRLGFPLIWNDRYTSVFDVDQYEAAVLKPRQQRLCCLWRSWHLCMPGMERQLRGFLPRHGIDMEASYDDRSHRQQRQLRACELPLGANVRAVENAPDAWSARPRSCRQEIRRLDGVAHRRAEPARAASVAVSVRHMRREERDDDWKSQAWQVRQVPP